ncbi:MAG: glycogen/starch/alpha-glucan phosphorylase [Provencibacterium sp.]|jgi:starch phosphorylase|nr:glycogen/starch/alpha-glucan phosphorylase [Provencibacterium sp.]
MEYTALEIRQLISRYLNESMSVTEETASDLQFYKAMVMTVKEILEKKRRHFISNARSQGRKQVYYLCMEFLLGRGLKSSIANLGMEEPFQQALEQMNVKLENLYEYEPDAGLGNGGLGRLAACFMDALATTGYPAMGYCILYEFGIFKQQLVDGWQNELPDYWLPGGEVWLTPMPEHAVEVRFGGTVTESWDNNYHHLEHTGYTSVMALPYDINICGYKSEAVSRLRLWKAKSTGFNMELFNRGEYSGAVGDNAMAEAISKILYPNDNHREGKLLRLKQQYFLTCASIADIIRRHMENYGTLENFPEKNAIHLNDTHPILAIPELMRMLLDECGYSWEHAYHIVSNTFTYTNHTVMPEALECWSEDLFRNLLPRIYQIVCEINARYCRELYERYHLDPATVGRMAILGNHSIRMANLAVCVCSKVNGVSKLHSDILKGQVFADFYRLTPGKFTSVTNGIASRRWLHQSNPGLSGLLCELLGEDYQKDLSSLSGLLRYSGDTAVLDRLAQIKEQNKRRLSDYLVRHNSASLNPDSVFDVQVKRLHEYKRQHLNALRIIAYYQYLKDHPNDNLPPRTFIFGAKAAPGYFLAKQIIKLICSLGNMIDKDPAVRDKIRIVYLEDYRVTLSELLMPASEISEQISLAGTEASGTSNMKFMLNGAVTLGTMDGANVEIYDAVGKENIVIFGMTTPEVTALRSKGYSPHQIYQSNPVLHAALDMLRSGIAGNTFEDIYQSLVYTDPYMVLADFDSYMNASQQILGLYGDRYRWQEMALHNIAQSGIFCADRAIREYARNIWNLD